MQVSLENGIVLNFDARVLPSNLSLPSPSRFMLAAHDGAASALDVNPHVRGCLVTGGTDKMVKVWNVNEKNDGKREVSLVTSRDLGVVSPFPRLLVSRFMFTLFIYYRERFSLRRSLRTTRLLLPLRDPRRSFRSGTSVRMLTRARRFLKSSRKLGVNSARRRAEALLVCTVTMRKRLAGMKTIDEVV